MCANCLSKLEIKVDIYPNMVLLVKTLRDNCWSICCFSLIRDVERLHNIQFER